MAKIRKGFVSNSSSSSFIIAVPEGTELTLPSMHKAMYGTDDNLTFANEYNWHDGQVRVMSHAVVENIIAQIGDTGKLSTLMDVVNTSYGSDEWESFRLPEGDTRGAYDWDALHAYEEQQRKMLSDEIIQKFQGCDLYAVEFADDSTWGCEVEHGPALNQLNNVVRFSNH